MTMSLSSPTTPRITVWDSPEDIPHAIMLAVELKEEEEYIKWDVRARAKRALVAQSLVNKYRPDAIRPLLFRTLTLRSLDDALFLRNIVRTPAFPTSILATAIVHLHLCYTFSLATHWVHHIHWLMQRLQTTTFIWCPPQVADDTALAPAQVSPFAVIPRVPPSFLHIAFLDLRCMRLASCTALVRLVDSLCALRDVCCHALSFADSAPYTPPVWRERRTARPLVCCCIAGTRGMTLAAQAALASAILSVPARLGLEDAARGQPSSTPSSRSCPPPGRRSPSGSTIPGISSPPRSGQALHVGRRDAPTTMPLPPYPHAGPPAAARPLRAYISKISLTGSFPGMHTAGPTPLDALHSEHAAAPGERVGVGAAGGAGRPRGDEEDPVRGAAPHTALLGRRIPPAGVPAGAHRRGVRFARQRTDTFCAC